MRKYKGHLLAIVLVLGLAIAAGMPLFHGRFLSGHDALFYPARTVAFQAGLAEWRLLPRWSQQFGAGYGEPFFNFVPPFFCYLVVFLRLLGLGLTNAQNYACFALLAASGLAMYLLASSWFGKAGGLAAAAAYMYSPYMLLDLYVRSAYGELSALPFPPLIIWALYRLSATDKSRHFVAVALAYGALLLCNNPASLIFTPVLVLFVLLRAWRKRNLRTLLNGSAALALGLILSAFFWLPAFVEKQLVHTDSLLHGFLNYENHFVYFSQMIWSRWGYGISVPGPNDGMSFQIGPVHLLMTVISLCVLFTRSTRGDLELRWQVIFSLFVLMVGIVFASYLSEPAWRRLNTLQYVQFPWRFLALAAFGSSLMCAVPFRLMSGRKGPVLTSVCVIVAAILAFGFQHAKPENMLDIGEDYFRTENIISAKLEPTTVNEYRPRWAEADPPAPPNGTISIVRGNAAYTEQSASSIEHSLLVEAQQNSDVRLNIHYFPGWRVAVDGQAVDVTPSVPYGLMEFSIPQGSHRVDAVFGDTPIRTVAETVSAVGIILVFSLVANTWLKSSA